MQKILQPLTLCAIWLNKKVATLYDGGTGYNDAAVDGGCVLGCCVGYYSNTCCLNGTYNAGYQGKNFLAHNKC